MPDQNNPAHEDKLTADEAAQEIFDGLASSGYSLSEKVGVSRTLRRLLRTEAEDAQKQLSTLIDSL
ncbi:hypothetical protein GCM10028819_32030 [Spirosoma humi]